MTERHGPASEQQRASTAADWLFRLREPGVSADEISDWLAWCAASVENRHAFERMQSLWQQAGAIEERPIARADLEADGYQAQVPVAQWHERPAAPNQSGVASRRFKFMDLLAARPGMAAMVAVSVVALLLLSVWRSERMERVAAETFAADIGINRQIDLPDGSRVIVGAGSTLEAEFDATAREIRLERGEAYFKVHKDPARPFVVNAMGTSITAVGTQFNVKVDAGILRVTVTEGVVDVGREPTLLSTLRDTIVGADNFETIRLVSGNQVMRQSSAPLVVHTAVSDTATWMNGTLTFVGEPLAAVVAGVNRYSSRRLELSDRRLEALLFTGTVVTDRVEEWLQALPKIFPVHVVEGERGRVVIEPRAAAAT